MRKFLWMFESVMIEDSYNCRSGKGTLYGVRRVRANIEKVSEDYTKEAWILRCDLAGFFMSIDRDILWGMIETLIRKHYDADDTEWWLRLIRKVVYNRPEQNCVVKGGKGLWRKLPPNKSLFSGNGKGLPIGNLTSQIFANFYMTMFDRWTLRYFGKDAEYGRFVDDFICISRDKKLLLRYLRDARIYLREELGLTLHPKKVYLQEAKKGVMFTGTFIKPHRTYTSNRTVRNAFAVVEEWNSLSFADDMRYVSRLNSYMGFLIHNNSYAIRWQLWKRIEKKENVYCINMKKLKLKKKMI